MVILGILAWIWGAAAPNQLNSHSRDKEPAVTEDFAGRDRCDHRGTQMARVER
jgi:hypothetical protein